MTEARAPTLLLSATILHRTTRSEPYPSSMNWKYGARHWGVARMPMPSFQIARLPAFDARSMVATEYSIPFDPRLFTFSMF